MASHLKTALIDPYGREIDSLRISVTQRCDFSCIYCHKEGELNPRRELSIDEIERMAAVSSSLGISRFKITGGEPLLRQDIAELIEAISLYAEEVSMTTNGSQLEKMARRLERAGLKRVNVSLPSLRRETFRRITGVDALERVKRGIQTAIASELTPLKVNMVVLKSINSEELPLFIEYCREIGAILQLIELQPLRKGAEIWSQLHLDLKPVEERFRAEAIGVEEGGDQGRKRYHLRDGTVVEVVRSIENPDFCRNCHRLRLTSDGYLKPCLLRDDDLIDLLPILGSEASYEPLVKAFMDAVERRRPYWGC